MCKISQATINQAARSIIEAEIDILRGLAGHRYIYLDKEKGLLTVFKRPEHLQKSGNLPIWHADADHAKSFTEILAMMGNLEAVLSFRFRDLITDQPDRVDITPAKKTRKSKS